MERPIFLFEFGPDLGILCVLSNVALGDEVYIPLTAWGGVGSPYAWAMTVTGSTDLVLSPSDNTAILGGIPSSAGVITVDLRLTDGGLTSVRKTLTINVINV